MGRVFVHIGVPRSGTTTLQRNVFEQLEGIHYLGIGKPGRPHTRDPIAGEWRVANAALLQRTLLRSIARGGIRSRDDVKRLRTSLEKLKASGAPVIYSNESLCQSKYVSFAAVAAGINDIFGQSELIITVRDPQTVLPSQHLWEIAKISDTYSPFTKWLDDVIANPRRIGRAADSVEQYRYASMLEQLQSAFDGRLTILKYEDMIAEPAGFARSLGRSIGTEPEAITRLLRLPSQNVTAKRCLACLSSSGAQISVGGSLFSRLPACQNAGFVIRSWTGMVAKKRIDPITTALELRIFFLIR